MTTPLLDRTKFGPPEQWDDIVRAYRSSARYIPTALEQLLFELAGHRCTICKAPWMEIHHIQELENGGETKYENLIVLCPNCHTRVHSEGVPSNEELRHYKTKQEIAYELPILDRLSTEERAFLTELSTKTIEQRLAFSKRYWKDVTASDQDQAVESYRVEIGYVELQRNEMARVELESAISLACGNSVSVSLRVHLTGKGTKWLQYLEATNRVPQ
jgi:5-methylcytosine-specific restriction endonuclease McrA